MKRRPLPTITPAPVGDALDTLLLESAQSVVNFPGVRISGLQSSEGRHSPTLLDEIRVWIAEGSLRDRQQVNRALGMWRDHYDRLTALGVLDFDFREGAIPWALTPWSIRELRHFFGVPGSTPLPTKAEVIENQERIRREWQERCERDAAQERLVAVEIEAKRQAFAESPAGKQKERLSEALDRIVGVATGDPVADWSIADEKKEIKPYVRHAVKRSTFSAREIAKRWKSAVADHIEMFEEVEGTEDEKRLIDWRVFAMREILRVAEEVASFGPSKLRDLQPGESRLLFTREEMLADFKNDPAKWINILREHDIITSLGFDGKFAIDIVAKEISEEADHGVTVECAN